MIFFFLFFLIILKFSLPNLKIKLLTTDKCLLLLENTGLMPCKILSYEFISVPNIKTCFSGKAKVIKGIPTPFILYNSSIIGVAKFYSVNFNEILENILSKNKFFVDVTYKYFIFKTKKRFRL